MDLLAKTIIMPPKIILNSEYLPCNLKYNLKYTRNLKSIAHGPGSRLSCFRYVLSVAVMSIVVYTRYTPWLISSINVDPLSACMHVPAAVCGMDYNNLPR